MATEYFVLRDYQNETEEACLSERDVLVSAPIGAGKSLTSELALHAFDCFMERIAAIETPLSCYVWFR